MKGGSMKHAKIIPTLLVVLLVLGGMVGCRNFHHSIFADQSVKAVDLVKLKYRTLKVGAVGESHGFKLLWIPFASPTEWEAKRDMLDRLKKEGIETTGKNIAFTNATADRGGFGLIGLIGAPVITLTADVIEILGEQTPSAPSPSVQPAQ
jgi:hypothetical protein